VTAAGLKTNMRHLPDDDEWYSHFDIVSAFYGRSVRRDRNGKSRSRCQSDKMSYQHCRVILTSDKTSCARGDTICPAPASLTIISCKYENRQSLQFTTEFGQAQMTTTRKNKHCAILPSLCCHCQSEAKRSRIWAQAMPYLPIKQVDLWPSDLERGVRVTCDVGYLCVNFSIPRPLCSRLRPHVRVRRQTSDRRQTASSLYAPPIRCGAFLGRLIGEGVGNCRDCPLATPVIQAIWAERAGKVVHRGQLIICWPRLSEKAFITINVNNMMHQLDYLFPDWQILPVTLVLTLLLTHCS